jgi:TRAP-type C4-dicarboxylate transport system permease small subunit
VSDPTLIAGPDETGPLRAFKSLIRSLDRISFSVVVLVMAAMTILVVAQVFFRYILSSSIDSADELSRLFFVWAIFLAIPHGVKYGVHVGIDLLVRLLPQKAQDAVFRLSCLAGAALMIVTFAVSWTATMDKWPELMPTLPVTAALFYIPVLICAGHSFIHLVAQTWGGPNTWIGETEL